MHFSISLIIQLKKECASCVHSAVLQISDHCILLACHPTLIALLRQPHACGRPYRISGIWPVFHQSESKFTDAPADTRGPSNIKQSFCVRKLPVKIASVGLYVFTPTRQIAACCSAAVNTRVCAVLYECISDEGRKHRCTV